MLRKRVYNVAKKTIELLENIADECFIFLSNYRKPKLEYVKVKPQRNSTKYPSKDLERF